jgi:hypothetical protein
LENIKRILVSIAIFFLFSSAFLFAEDNNLIVDVSQSFELFHNVSVEKSYSFQFVNPSNNYSQYSGPASLTLAENQFFASLVLKFNVEIVFSRIALGFEPLHSGTPVDGEYDCVPYVMNVYKANERIQSGLIGTVTTTSLTTPVVGESVAIAGTVNVINTNTTYSHQGTETIDTPRRLADLVISVNGNEAQAGVYSANIYCYFEGGN